MKIVVLDGYTLNPGDLDWSEVEKLGELIVYDRTSQQEVVKRCEGAEAIFTNKTALGAATLNQLPELKYIGVLATGFNIIDTETAKKNGVIVCNVPGYGTQSVAQFTFALLLELCHHVQEHSDSVKNGGWTRSPDFSYWNSPLIELAGKTIGIIGFGHIGRKVGDIASAFGMDIIASGRTHTNQPGRSNFRWVSMDELLKESDVISIHCPLTNDTQGLINTTNLRKMKRSAFLLNTSRGPIINDADLAEALNEGLIAGAAIDVLSVEPPPADNPLFKAKNCIITPHIAWATSEARARLMDTVVSNLAAFTSGAPVNVVNA